MSHSPGRHRNHHYHHCCHRMLRLGHFSDCDSASRPSHTRAHTHTTELHSHSHPHPHHHAPPTRQHHVIAVTGCFVQGTSSVADQPGSSFMNWGSVTYSTAVNSAVRTHDTHTHTHTQAHTHNTHTHTHTHTHTYRQRHHHHHQQQQQQLRQPLP
jgi:hypothetical protein